MKNKCLYCYKELNAQTDFHEKCALDFFGISNVPSVGYSYNEMAKLAKNVVERSISVPGVQPKLSMSLLDSSENNLTNRLTVVGALGGSYILKPPSEKFIQMPENEHLTMRMAEVFGIPVVKSSLIKLASGELCYITKRIDRAKNGTKIHMLDMFQITEAFDKYKGSMEKIGKAITSFSNNLLLDKSYLFDITLFSFLTGNNDMHLKNFSMINASSGWVLAPAYDLLNVSIVLPEDTEELALTVCGKKKKLKKEHFESLAKSFDLTTKQTINAFNRAKKKKEQLLRLIETSFLSDEMKQLYLQLLIKRYNQLAIDG